MRVVLLGRVGIVADGSYLHIGRPQARSVLALLALSTGQPVSTSRIVDALWGGAGPATARAQIHSAVSAIRRSFAAAGVLDAVESGGFGYRLAVPSTSVDIIEFDRLSTLARDVVGHDADTAALALREALGLFQGEPLVDAVGAFVDAARAHLVERQLLAQEQLADIELDRNCGAAVIADLMPAVERYPYREGLRLRLMRALDQSGRCAEALQVFRAYRRMLAEEEGLDPGPEIGRVAIEILRGTAWPQAAGPARGGSTHVAAVPAVPSGRDRVPAQLPAAVPDFLGRRGYLHELDIIIGDRGRPNRVVAVTGMAGVGKTALVTHWAHRVAGDYPDGQLFVDLRGFPPGRALSSVVALARLLRALGEPADAIPTDLDEAAASYRSRVSGRRLLVVLDNASGADQVRHLLPGTSDCVTVITSRDSLTGLVGLDGVHRLKLDPMAREDAARLVSNLLAGHGVVVEPQVAATIATMCGRFPLAVRLAAANLADGSWTSRGWPEVLTRAGLDTKAQLDLMQADGDQLASVRNAFGLTYQSLPRATRNAFRLLSVIPGADFTGELAAWVIGRDDVASDLVQLERLSLIQSVAESRFTMHDLVRVYADALSREDSQAERTTAVERMHAWYLERVAATAAILNPQMLRLPSPGRTPTVSFEDRPAALAWLDTELYNLVGAVEHAAENGPPGVAIRLADGLRGYFWIRRYATEWLAVASAGVRAAERDHDLAGVAAGQISLAAAYRSMSRYDESMAAIGHAVTASRGVPWPEAEATALSHLAIVLAETGKTLSAREHLIEALAVNRRLGRAGSEAVVLGNLGSLRIRIGELTQARHDLIAAVQLYRQVGSAGGEAITLSNLGLVYYYLGDPGRAARHLAKALDAQRQIGDRYGETVSQCNRALLYCDMGRLPEALELANEALELSQETGDRQAEASVLTVLGNIRLALGARGAALDYYRQARSLASSAQDQLPAIDAMIGEARAQLAIGALDESTGLSTLAQNRAKEYSFRLLAANALTVLAASHHAADRPSDARACANAALKQHSAMGHRPGVARSHEILAEICRSNGDLDSSASILDPARGRIPDVGAAGSGGVAAST
jgi:DNA-binding SARP family transcriptional activator/tetratricopeptide (TPR) repeat protein